MLPEVHGIFPVCSRRVSSRPRQPCRFPGGKPPNKTRFTRQTRGCLRCRELRARQGEGREGGVWFDGSPSPVRHERIAHAAQGKETPTFARPLPSRPASSIPAPYLEARCSPARGQLRWEKAGTVRQAGARGSGMAAPRQPAPRSSMPPLFSLLGQKRGFCELGPAAARHRSPGVFLPAALRRQKHSPAAASCHRRRIFTYLFLCSANGSGRGEARWSCWVNICMWQTPRNSLCLY